MLPTFFLGEIDAIPKVVSSQTPRSPRATNAYAVDVDRQHDLRHTLQGLLLGALPDAELAADGRTTPAGNGILARE